MFITRARTTKYVHSIEIFPYGSTIKELLLLREPQELTLCTLTAAAKESKINNQFISPHNARYSNQQYARFRMRIIPPLLVLFHLSLSLFFFFHFLYAPFFFFTFFTLSLNLFRVTRFITASFVLPRPAAESTFQSNRFKFNIPDLKVYSVYYYTQRENDSAVYIMFSTRRGDYIISQCYDVVAKTAFPRFIDFNSDVSRRLWTFIFCVQSFFYFII